MALAQRKAVPTGLVELENDLWITVDEIQRVIRSDAQAMGILEDTFTPGVDQLPDVSKTT